MGEIKHERSREQQYPSSDHHVVPNRKLEHIVEQARVGSHLYQRAYHDPRSLSHTEMQVLQWAIGNRAVAQLFRVSSQGQADEHFSLQSNLSQFARRRDSEETQTQEVTSSENNTGLPDRLKANVENLSGLSMDDVHVHYNSSKPAEVQALAYTQDTEIYVGPGQEKHLAHEAWHVVQQKEGRVQPTMQTRGMAINDDQKLESEATVMGQRAHQLRSESMPTVPLATVSEISSVENDSGPSQFSHFMTPSKAANNMVQSFKAAQQRQPGGTPVVQLFPPNDFEVGDHFRQRMTNYGITEANVDNVVLNGTQYKDPDYEGATIYFRNRIAVVYDGTKLQTCYRGKLKNRWIPK